MTTRSTIYTIPHVEVINFTSSDFDLDQENTTAQSASFTLPAQNQMLAIAVETQEGVVGSGLTAFNITVGLSAGGTEFLSATDLDTASTTGAFQYAVPTQEYPLADDIVYVSFTPVDANWSDLTSVGDFTVKFIILDLTGKNPQF